MYCPTGEQKYFHILEDSRNTISEVHDWLKVTTSSSCGDICSLFHIAQEEAVDILVQFDRNSQEMTWFNGSCSLTMNVCVDHLAVVD